jgi:hypothetical protein
LRSSLIGNTERTRRHLGWAEQPDSDHGQFHGEDRNDAGGSDWNGLVAGRRFSRLNQWKASDRRADARLRAVAIERRDPEGAFCLPNSIPGAKCVAQHLFAGTHAPALRAISDPEFPRMVSQRLLARCLELTYHTP